MNGLTDSELIPKLQTAIGPVILISGVGLFLLTATNRLGRTIDRARTLANESNGANPDVREQIKILWVRARLLRTSIFFAALSALFSAALVISLFIAIFFRIEMGAGLGGLFVLSMLSLIASLVWFIKDVNKSLAALRIELNLKGMGV